MSSHLLEALASSGPARSAGTLLADGFQFHPKSLPWIHLAWLAPLLALLYLRSFYQKRTALRLFAGAEVLRHLIPSVSWQRQYARAAMVLGAILLLVVAIARPQWGTDLQEIRRKGIDLVVLLDLSKSMLAEDMGAGDEGHARSRLDWAKADLAELVAGLSGDRIALVPFAGRAEIRCPLTFDYGFFRRILDELRIGSVDDPGTAIGVAIQKGLECFQDTVKNHKAILLITDGEDHEAYVKEAAEKAKDRGVRIFSIGVGESGEGKRIPITDSNGNRVYLQDKDGKEVWTKMDPRALLDAGEITDGGYAPAYVRKEGGREGEITGVLDLYRKIVEKVTAQELEAAKEERFRDQFQWFLAAAFVLLALEPLVRTRRGTAAAAVEAARKAPGQGAPGQKAPGRTRAAAAAAPSILLPFLLPVLILGGAAAPGASSLRAGEFERLLAEGNRLFAEGKFPAAEEKYLEAKIQKQDSAEVPYNIANTFFRREDFPKAIEGYGEALKLARERDLETRIKYNLACARARESERFVSDLTSQENLQKGVDLLRESIGGFRDVLEIDAAHAGARENLSIAQLRIKNLLDQLKKLREEAEKKAKEEREKKKDPVEVLRQLIAEEKGEIDLTAGARKREADAGALRASAEKLAALPPGEGRGAALEKILADPAFTVGASEASEALKLGRGGDGDASAAKLKEARERIEKEAATLDESRGKDVTKDREDQTRTTGLDLGLAQGLRDAAEGKNGPPAAPAGQNPPPPGAAPQPPPPQPPTPEVAERLQAIAKLCDEASQKMMEALGALGGPKQDAPPPAPSATGAQGGPSPPPPPPPEKEAPPAKLPEAEAAQRAALAVLEKALEEAQKLPPKEPPPQNNDQKQEEKKDQDQKKDEKKDEKKDGKKSDEKKDQKKDGEKKDSGQKDDKKDSEGQQDEKKSGEKKDAGKKEPGQKKDQEKMDQEKAEQALRKFLEKDAEKRRDRDQRRATGSGGRMQREKDW